MIIIKYRRVVTSGVGDRRIRVYKLGTISIMYKMKK